MSLWAPYELNTNRLIVYFILSLKNEISILIVLLYYVEVYYYTLSIFKIFIKFNFELI
jgi:hypothetical protein